MNDMATGFKGLTTMVSDVDSLIQAAQSKASQSSESAIGNSLPSATLPTTDSSSESTAKNQPNGRSTRPFVQRFAAGAGIVCILVFLYAIYQKSPQPRAAHNASSSLLSNAGKQTSPPDFSQQLKEDIPPIGTDRVLTSAEIQYCLAEAIRLEAASLLVHDTDDAGDIVRYNVMIDDYNQRCSRYRYHRATFQSAKNAVELHRTRLQAEGAKRFRSSLDEIPTLKHSSESSPKTSALDIYPQMPPAKKTGPNADVLMENEVRHSVLIDESPVPEETPVDLPEERAVHSKKVVGDEPYPHDMTPVLKQDAAVNLKQCLDGRYSALCDHALLTQSQSEEVLAAEQAANLKECLNGLTPLCNHKLLTPAQAIEVAEAERRTTYAICIEGRYPVLCDEGVLSPEQQMSLKELRDTAQRAEQGN